MKRLINYRFAFANEDVQIVLCSDVIRNIPNHAVFSSLTAQVDELNLAYQQWLSAIASSANKDLSKIALKQAKREVTVNLLYRLGIEVDLVANGNRETALLSSFPLKSVPQRVTEMAAPVIEKITKLANSGSVKVQWTPVRGVIAYAVETSTDNQATWQNGTYCRSIKKKLVGFTPGITTWFRVKALGSNLESDWSTPVAMMMS